MRTPLAILGLLLVAHAPQPAVGVADNSPDMLIFMEGLSGGILTGLLWNSVPVWGMFNKGAFEAAIRPQSVLNWGNLRQPIAILGELISTNLEWLKMEGFALRMTQCPEHVRFCQCMQKCDSWTHWKDWSVLEMAHALATVATSRNIDFMSTRKSIFVDRAVFLLDQIQAKLELIAGDDNLQIIHVNRFRFYHLLALTGIEPLEEMFEKLVSTANGQLNPLIGSGDPTQWYNWPVCRGIFEEATDPNPVVYCVTDKLYTSASNDKASALMLRTTGLKHLAPFSETNRMEDISICLDLPYWTMIHADC